MLHYELNVDESLNDKRLDQAIAELLPEHSRGRIQNWIKAGYVMLNAECIEKKRHKVSTDDQVVIDAPNNPQIEWQAQDIPLDIVYEDEHMLVLNKTAGVVVHPAIGHHQNTLVNALLHHSSDLACLPRAGLIHRLDKDTTGLLVVAKSLEAHTRLVNMMQERQIKRQYETIVIGHFTAGDTVDAPIGRHPRTRIKMAVVKNGKPAVTHYQILKRFRGHTHLQVQLETGRTHQIRVHMEHIKHPILGDQTYGGKPYFPKAASKELIEAIQRIKRQALHAQQLALDHPITQEPLSWQAPLPDDMQQLLEILTQDQAQSS